MADRSSDPAWTIAAAPALARFVLRARPVAQAAAAEPLGMALPTLPCRSATADERSALWLGPDEWLLLVPEGDTVPVALATALGALPHALVDVGHRQSGMVVGGTCCTDVLNAGCALDLDLQAFPVGMCTRTLLGKADIALWRTGERLFHIEAWRSFLPYVQGFLAEAAREFGG